MPQLKDCFVMINERSLFVSNISRDHEYRDPWVMLTPNIMHAKVFTSQKKLEKFRLKYLLPKEFLAVPLRSFDITKRKD